MSVDKALYELPQGLAAIDGPDIEIEVEPEGEMEVDIVEISDEFHENLAETIPDSVLATLGSELIDDFTSDVDSRKDWIQTYVDGLELLGLKIEERSEPWEGACGVYHPILAEAVVKFQAETIMETFPASGPVRTQIIGKETPEKKESATRVEEDMNYEITDVMTEFRPEHERMLWGMGLSGNGFKKVYEDGQIGRQVSMYVPADDLVVPYGASNLQTAERITHVMRKTENEMRKLQVSGFYRDVDLGDPVNVLDEVEKKIAEKLGFRATTDDRFKVLEMHVDLDLEGYEHTDESGEPTGIALPYVVSIEKNTGTVLSIRRNWREGDKKHEKRQHFVHYGYIPGFGFYCFGIVHLLGAFAKSGTSILRQLVDAGSLANLPGGFKTRGLRVKGDDTPIAPGEFRDVDVPSGAMKDNIMPLPYKEPSQTLITLLNQIIEDGRRFASAGDLKVADMSANSPVGTTLAILERTLKVMSAIQARIHYSMKQEFKLLKEIIASNAPDEYGYQPQEGSRKAKKSDYDAVNIIPVSDPNAATMSQKVVQYQAVLQLSQTAPQLYNLPFLHRQMLGVIGIKNAAKLVPLPEDEKPCDPITENMNVLKSKPLKAFMYQDHEAHIKIHMAAMNDPKIKQAIGQNPQAPIMFQAMQAHITEHVGMEYKRQMEEAMGIQIPYEDDTGENHMTPQMEMQISRMAVPVAQQLLNQNKTAIAAQQAQQAAQDPVIQMQMKELQLKAQEIGIKEKKMAMDAAAKADQIEIEKQRIIAQKEIAGMQVGAKTAKDKADLEAKQRLEGLRIGAQIGADRARSQNDKNRMAVDLMKHNSTNPKKENK
jgi:putative ubiquitin-RnfH superfamily antitoxin RatB of RatAB toxin-antitoxin module